MSETTKEATHQHQWASGRVSEFDGPIADCKSLWCIEKDRDGLRAEVENLKKLTWGEGLRDELGEVHSRLDSEARTNRDLRAEVKSLNEAGERLARDLISMIDAEDEARMNDAGGQSDLMMESARATVAAIPEGWRER